MSEEFDKEPEEAVEEIGEDGDKIIIDKDEELDTFAFYQADDETNEEYSY